MYVRRKVFSLGEGNIDYDYNIYQQLYSEAFEEGVDYAIEKMFASDRSVVFDDGGFEEFEEPTPASDKGNNSKGDGKGTGDSKGDGKSDSKGTGESAKKDNIFNRAWKKVRDDWWEKGQGWRDETTNDAGEKVKKINWKRAGKRAGLIAVPTAAVAVPTALAIRHHNKKKAAEAEN